MTNFEKDKSTQATPPVQQVPDGDVQPVPIVQVPEQKPAMRWIVPGDFGRPAERREGDAPV